MMNDQQDSAKLAAPPEPDPNTWLTPARRKLVVDQTRTLQPLLRQAGLWRATLSYWVRWQASLEAGWSQEEEKNVLINFSRNGNIKKMLRSIKLLKS